MFKNAELGNKTRSMIFSKFFTINNLQQISGKYSKNTLTADSNRVN